ncbi:hypothetical protein Vadar_001843 [Vaccinium darrowii]|uniref:Uncharacterized protein n=1 Tax=Vaccinium darrowii TaxID=229202 RepID=A0ACB7XW53_9ERIC|nr:hypothetical protein Vadar_001843 [Vaccinium darrowii]
MAYRWRLYQSLALLEAAKQLWPEKKRDLLFRILEQIKEVKPEDYKSSEDKLGEDVLKCMKGRKYLIAMDDIWGIEAWNDIQRSFPMEYKGSKVLFTSRFPVQPDSVDYVPHHLAPLPKHLCWELLQKKVFGIEMKCPPELVDIASDSLLTPFSYLLNLETLNIDLRFRGEFIKLHRDIFKMVKLRHLYSKDGVITFHHTSEETGGIDFDRSSKLNSLQTLHRICTCNVCRSFLVRTPNLRKLGLHGGMVTEDNVLRFPDLESLKCLMKLTLSAKVEFDLRVKSTLLQGMKLPLTIMRITLKSTCLKWEELSLLQTLPSLAVLRLIEHACCGPVWNISELEGFHQLKYLRFYLLDIEEWDASEDQFPNLEVLVLECCNRLNGIPIDFGNLNKLREIKECLLAWYPRFAADDTGVAGETLHSFARPRCSPVEASESANPVRYPLEVGYAVKSSFAEDGVLYPLEKVFFLPKPPTLILHEENDDDDAVDQHLERIRNEGGGDESDEENIKKTNPGIAFTNIAKVLGEKWKKMSAEEKEPYEVKARADKKRYSDQISSYKNPQPMNIDSGNESDSA